MEKRSWIDTWVSAFPAYDPPKRRTSRDGLVLPSQYYEKTTITVTSDSGVTEDRIREIVREEIADLPIRYDVPDAPPEK